MKKFVFVVVLVIAGTMFRGWLRPPSVHAATTQLTKTQARLSDAASESAARASMLDAQLANPTHNEMPARLLEFTRSTEHLRHLRDELNNAVTSYAEARNAKLAAFDQELQAMKDGATKRAMEELRQRADQESATREDAARQALGTLDAVLAQGADLQHAAHCVQLADELTTEGQDVQQAALQARARAAAYTHLTITLLASLTTAHANAD